MKAYSRPVQNEDISDNQKYYQIIQFKSTYLKLKKKLSAEATDFLDQPFWNTLIYVRESYFCLNYCKKTEKVNLTKAFFTLSDQNFDNSVCNQDRPLLKITT